MSDLVYFDGMPEQGLPYFFSMRAGNGEIMHICKSCVMNVIELGPELENGESDCDICGKETWRE
jgi:hypothetical protein